MFGGSPPRLGSGINKKDFESDGGDENNGKHYRSCDGSFCCCPNRNPAR
jgi:hypothetical protein